MISKGLGALGALGVLLAGSLCAFGQSSTVSQAGVSYPDTSPPRGVSPTGAYDFDKLETINKATGGLTYTIPLTSMPLGRGGMTLPINLTYNSGQYDYSYSYTFGTQSPYPPFLYQALSADAFGGWSLTPGYSIYIETKPFPYAGATCNSGFGVMRTSLVMPDGSRHVLYFGGFPQGFIGGGDGYFPWSYSGGTMCPQQYTSLTGDIKLFTIDGSYISVLFSPSTGNWVASLPDGSTVTQSVSSAPSQVIADRNGNKITIANYTSGSNNYTSVTDDIGRQIIIENGLNGWNWTVTQNGFNQAPLTWTFSTSSAGTTTFQFQYICQNSQSSSGQFVSTKVCWATGEGGGTSTLTVPSNDPANPLQYQFSYGTQSGLLQSVTLPSGATTTYSYQCNNYSSCFDVRTDLLNPVVSKTRTWTDQADGSLRTEFWSFGGSGYSYAQNFVKTNPDNGVETTYLAGRSMPMPTRVVQPNGDSVDYWYGMNRPYGVAYGAPNPYLMAEVHNMGQSVSALTSYQYDKNGNQLSATAYDWGAYSSSNRDSNGALTAAPTPTGSQLRYTQKTYTVSTAAMAGSGSESISDDTNAYWNPAAPRFLHLPAVSSVTGSGPGSLTAYSYYSGTANLSSVSQWDSTKSATRPAASALNRSNASVTSWTWDGYGNMTTEFDANQGQTNYSYDANSLYLAQKVEAVGYPFSRTFSYNWDQSLGVLTQKTDVDNGVTTYFGYDATGRQTSVTEGAGGATRQTATIYNDAAENVTVKRDQNTSGDGVLTSLSGYDALYRPASTQMQEGSGSAVNTQTRYMYSGSNSYKLESNPFRTVGDATMGWTLTTFDQNGRAISIQNFSGAAFPTPFGGNTVTTGTETIAYNAQYTTTTDQAGAQRMTSVDGLGRLISVTEYPGSGTTYSTSYTYDSLDDLIGVNQSGRTRTFAYDSLKRLVGATNPETTSASSPASQSCTSGTFAVCYTYDANGNLTSKMDNRGAKTTYYYDGLNRVILKSYGSPSGVAYTPQAYYCYDSIQTSGCPNTGSVPYSRGRLTAVTNGNSTNLYTNYDALGHILSHQQLTGSQTYSFSYSYNLADALVTEVYPSGRAITNCYDGANRVTQVSAVNCGTTAGSYASGVQYAPQGAAASYTFGNGLARTMSYNPRMQVSGFQDVAASGNAYITASLNWSASTDNGNLVSANYIHLGGVGLTSPLPLPQSYTYDGANRLTSVTDNGNTRGFGYDAFGNMWVSALGTNLPYSGNTLQANIFNANNQINDGMTTYDAAGNQTYVNGNGLIYDVEGRQTSVNGLGVNENYVYDGDGRRVEKVGVKSGVTTVFVYDVLGRMAAEYSTAAENPNCVTCYLSDDHLGTPRLVTDQAGNVIARHDYMPFGEEFAAGQDGRGVQWGPGGDSINQKFTGKERDSESQLDYFGARYYGWALGRFASPDEVFADQDEHDPQSWNLYNYVRNNPLRNVDLYGRTCSHAKDPQGRDVITDVDGNGCAELHDNTVHAYDEPGIAMLAGLGALYSGPNMAQFVSEAARATAKVAAPEASAAAECITPGGNCDTINLAMAMLPHIPGLGNLGQFIEGQVIKRVIQTPEGPLVFTATVEVVGDTVKLKAASLVHADGAQVVTNPGPGTIKAAFDSLKSELRQAGFAKAQVTALRISGANSPRLINKTFNLK